MEEAEPLSIVQQYLRAVEEGATGERLAAFYTADAVQEELPNRLVAQGARRDLSEILAAAERGQKVMASQRYELINQVVQGNRVAIEVRWTGSLRAPVPGLPDPMHAQFAMFIELERGRIRRQRNYDCFEPW